MPVNRLRNQIYDRIQPAFNAQKRVELGLAMLGSKRCRHEYLDRVKSRRCLRQAEQERL